MRVARLAVGLLLLLVTGNASANYALSARGPAGDEESDSRAAYALGGGVIRIRDGRQYSLTTLPYFEFFALRALGANGDLEARLTTTGATFAEAGGRLRFGRDSFSMGARGGVLLGAASQGPLWGAYGGVLASAGTSTTQASVGLDVLRFLGDTQPTEAPSSVVLRPFVGLEIAVGKTTYFYARMVYYTHYRDPFFKYGSPALLAGAAW